VVIRIGQRIYLACEDATPYRRHGVAVVEGAVVGPALAEALERVREAGRGEVSLLIQGESGVGKEMAARSFHAAGGRASAPFVAVNCAAIPEGVAERLLFGATRGAFSGATDAPGYLQAADGGTLFLDEIGELSPAVQAKLLRVLESREVTPVGAARPQPVAVRFCFATLRNLRHMFAEQKFRPDLYFRIARATVVLPPLRERLEEVPWMVVRELAAIDPALVARASLVEACMLADLTGNVRELVSRVRHAAGEARRAGTSEVSAAHLPDPGVSAPSLEPRELSPDELRAALAAHQGNLTAAARALGMHRSHLYRLLERHGIERPSRR
jgi:transcriptional regulator with PAS, ATPase and Fis domain